uniref:ORF3 n=1 Tax=Giant panda anellovirus TaxID=2016460 RepID=A0A220IGJ6_9VIRU|nr:ORF3 [Giant panda anellovirus]
MMNKESSPNTRWKELLGMLSTDKETWWRSSPGLYDSQESENESRGKMKRKKQLVPPTPTPKKGKLNVSGIWPHASDSDWSESEGGDFRMAEFMLPPAVETERPQGKRSL